MAGVLVGDVAEKYREVHNSGSISCDLGYIVGKAMSFKRNGARRKVGRERKELTTESHPPASPGGEADGGPLKRSLL